MSRVALFARIRSPPPFPRAVRIPAACRRYRYAVSGWSATHAAALRSNSSAHDPGVHPFRDRRERVILAWGVATLGFTAHPLRDDCVTCNIVTIGVGAAQKRSVRPLRLTRVTMLRTWQFSRGRLRAIGGEPKTFSELCYPIGVELIRRTAAVPTSRKLEHLLEDPSHLVRAHAARVRKPFDVHTLNRSSASVDFTGDIARTHSLADLSDCQRNLENLPREAVRPVGSNLILLLQQRRDDPIPPSVRSGNRHQREPDLDVPIFESRIGVRWVNGDPTQIREPPCQQPVSKRERSPIEFTSRKRERDVGAGPLAHVDRDDPAFGGVVCEALRWKDFQEVDDNGLPMQTTFDKLDELTVIGTRSI